MDKDTLKFKINNDTSDILFKYHIKQLCIINFTLCFIELIIFMIGLIFKTSIYLWPISLTILLFVFFNCIVCNYNYKKAKKALNRFNKKVSNVIDNL